MNRDYKKWAERFRRAAIESSTAKEWLAGRGLTDAVAEQFSLGFFPESHPFPQTHQKLEELRGRIIFPIKNEFGDVIAFSGRLLDAQSSDRKRWWHESYDKSSILYGLDQAYEAILETGYAVIVEGQTDVISCHAHGIGNAVGLMGTALTDHQFLKLSRFTDTFVLILDGDEAGRAASEKIQKQIGGYVGLSVWDVELKFNGSVYDPHEFLTKMGGEALEELIGEAMKEKCKNG